MTLSSFMDLGATLLQKPNSTLSRPLNSSSLQYLDDLAYSIMSQYPQDSFKDLVKNLNVNTWAV